MTDWRAKEAKYFMHPGRRMNLLTVRGEGAHLWDEDGKQYLDFFGGPATVRASLSLHNTVHDIEELLDGLQAARERLS